MGAVISIEKAAHFGLKDVAYSGFTMTTLKSNHLLMIKMPVALGRPPQDLLVQVRSVSKNPRGPAISVVICDQGDTPLIRHFPGSSEMPARHDVRDMGEMAEFMSRHSDRMQALILAGAAAHGNLTIARAIHLMASQDLSAQDALHEATMIDQAVQSMNERQQRLAQAAVAN